MCGLFNQVQLVQWEILGQLDPKVLRVIQAPLALWDHREIQERLVLLVQQEEQDSLGQQGQQVGLE